MIRFPSEEFFQGLCDQANANPDRFRRLGTVDMTLAVKIGYDASSSECYEIVFSGYRCVSVARVADASQVSSEAVVLSGSYSAWRKMIENIVANGQADMDHTLNTLTLLDEPLRVDSANQLNTDLFYRYQQNLQEFFDGAAQVHPYIADTDSASLIAAR